MIASSPPPTTTSPPRTPRRPSMSNPMSWLGRTHAQPPSTTMRISEPKLVNDMFTPTGGTTYSAPRYGVLGTGATVVRTPQDALARAAAPQDVFEDEDEDEDDDDDLSSYEDEPEPASPGSPPLPALPFTSKSSPDLPVLGELHDAPSPVRARPTRAPPAAPAPVPVPVLPLNVSPTPPQPPFAPVLLAPVPDALLDLSTLLVTLDTSTSALRTTYGTLTSRPSHLADFLRSIASAAREREKRRFRDTLVEVDEEEDEEDDDGCRLSSPSTPFQSLFAAHLTAAGLLPQSASMIHLFLDRPSAPYTHILTYLRSPVEHPTLPRAAALSPRNSQSHDDHRLEALLELRDEARYLGLDELHKLCCDELRHRQGHVRGGAGSTASSGSGQVLLLHERGRDAGLVRLGAIARHEVKQSHVVVQPQERDSAGSFGHAFDVARVEGSPVAHAPSVRTMSPSDRRVRRSRSHSRGNPRSASDWI